MFFTTPLAILAVAATVSASPVDRRAGQVVLPLSKVSKVSSMTNIVAKGQEKLNQINGVSPAKGNVDASSGPATNDDVSYVAAVSIGGNTWSLIVDTGSSNTWCGAQKACEKTSTGVSTGNSVSVSYGSGSFSGTEYTDKVTFGGLTVNSQSIGAATTSQGFSTVDGIIGFGPVDLTQGTVANTATVPTFMDNLYKQGSISTEVLGVYFKPESGSDTADANGELTLGGTDTAKYTGTLTYFPTLKSGTAAAYWGISVAKLAYGSTSLGTNINAIVDTGTTLIYLPSSAYSAFLSASGGKTDSASGLVIYSTKPTGNFAVTFGSTTYTLTPAQYLVPTAQYANFGLTSGKYYGWFANGGTGSVSCIIGQKFLENYYSVYDTTNARIGFATRA